MDNKYYLIKKIIIDLILEKISTIVANFSLRIHTFDIQVTMHRDKFL